MEIFLEEKDKTLIIRVDGKIDTASEKLFDEKIQSLYVQHAYLILDFKNLSYISSPAIRTLLELQKKCVMHKQHLKIINICARVMALFTASQITEILDVEQV